MGKREELLEKLTSEDKNEVREAIEALAEFPEEEVIKAIVDAVMRTKSKAVLEAARATLMSMEGCEEAICKEVLRFFEHPEPKLRQTAIEVLSHRGNACLGAVRKLLESEDYNMRKFALDILAGMGTEEALELVAKALTDENPNVSMTALEYLRNFSVYKEKVIEAIENFIPRVEGLYGLTTLATTIIYGDLKDKRLIEPLKGKLKEVKDPMEKHWIYKTLLFLGDKSVKEEALENAKSVGLEEDIKKDMEIFEIGEG